MKKILIKLFTVAWECPKCKRLNFSLLKCENCGEPLPEAMRPK